MRITRETLLKLAQDTASQRAHADLDILAVYLHGSLLDDEPLLGGTADIDLFFVRNDEPAFEREIVRISDEVHLDIAHHSRKIYRQTRQLRLHPWFGPVLYGCKILYDPQHFLDFTQASVRGQFYRPDQVLGRVRPQVENARQIWLSLSTAKSNADSETVTAYLRAVGLIANAIAGLSGKPLTERRFLLGFPKRAEAVGHPGLYPGLLGLLGGPMVDAPAIRAWLPAWRLAIESLPGDQTPPQLSPARIPYYLRAFDASLDSEQPLGGLWPLLRTWTEAIRLLPGDSPTREPWKDAITRLGLLGEAFSAREAALDAYLDQVEEILEDWARTNGA
jgi:hypothetical protein